MLTLLSHDDLQATISYFNKTYSIEFRFRRNDTEQIIITAYETTDNLPMLTATVLFDEKLEADQVIIKNYDENEGILEALKEMGFIEEAHQISEYSIFKARLTAKAMSHVDFQYRRKRRPTNK